MNKGVKYYIEPDGEFVIENYNLAGTFSNFLPGIAGLFGTPMWAFYVNRAQCVCSLGIKSKDTPIMEFLPANRAYQLTSTQGFRTFIKIKDKKGGVFYEPFQAELVDSTSPVRQKMFISSYELRLLETNPVEGLEIEVVYFTIPNENFAALARVINIKNISRKDLSLEILDGAPLMVPYGVSNDFLQMMRRTIEAWMLVENLKNFAPFYRLKVDPRDVSDITFINEGNFYLSSLKESKKKHSTLLPILVDPDIIFGHLNDFSCPVNFIKQHNFRFPSTQMTQSKLPCAMSFSSVKIKKRQSMSLFSLIGHIGSIDRLNSSISTVTKEEFFNNKREENKLVIKKLQEDILTSSAEKRYDYYCGQTFLDNVLRGGYPLTSKDNSHTFYVYSRKHGDLERDYNSFYIDPTYFSQGNGNFRDMGQNRRNDVFFNPDIKDSNILNFYSLIQLDGYNPLVLQGVKFKVREKDGLDKDLKGKLGGRHIEKLKDFLLIPFAPGELFMYLEKEGIKLKDKWQGFLDAVLKNCEEIYCAEHGEGFWIDHWTYNLDLVEAYLSIYPEALREILIDKREFTFYDNPFYVKPREEKCLLNGNNRVRQYNAIVKDAKKVQLIKDRKTFPYVVRANKGTGEIYKTNLIVKMLCLIVNKISTIDPHGIGIEMEADKPGWCDSMNGLPGLFGSSTPEVFELKRQIKFILGSLKGIDLDDSSKIKIPEELYDFMKRIESLIKKFAGVSLKKRDFYYWDSSSLIKEDYRRKVHFGLSGIEKSLTIGELKKMLEAFLSKTNYSVRKAYISGGKIYATYFINEVTDFTYLNKTDPKTELPLVRPKAFKSVKVPLFLEGIVRAMKIEGDIKKARALYRQLKKTGIFDKKLKMYKINECIEGLSEEAGRSSIFTPGWLENESIWLHMEYKYLLEILRSGLYEEFFEEFRNLLIPFQEPEVYGRSIFENSSFLVSSSFPDERMHGKGFVARLSGSTAEMLSIWLLMNIGREPFFLNDNDELNLRFRPALPGWLFSKTSQDGYPKNSFTFRFLGKIDVIYHNPRLKNTAGRNSVKVRFMVIRYRDGRKIEIKKDIIESPYAKDVRDRKVDRIDIYLG